VTDSPSPGSRREARETALAIVYEADLRGDDLLVALDRQVLDPPAYAEEVVRGLAEHLAEIDAVVEPALERWTLRRLPAVDRALLRLATYELAHRPDVPTSAVISEAVELAAQYSTEASGRFVNGVLASVAGRLRG
jgi:N utilization substance protein B